MNNKKYHYFILKKLIPARLEDGKDILDSKEFYKDGKWHLDSNLNLVLNDCIMDYGDYSWSDYVEATEEEVLDFINKMNK